MPKVLTKGIAVSVRVWKDSWGYKRRGASGTWVLGGVIGPGLVERLAPDLIDDPHSDVLALAARVQRRQAHLRLASLPRGSVVGAAFQPAYETTNLHFSVYATTYLI